MGTTLMSRRPEQGCGGTRRSGRGGEDVEHHVGSAGLHGGWLRGRPRARRYRPRRPRGRRAARSRARCQRRIPLPWLRAGPCAQSSPRRIPASTMRRGGVRCLCLRWAPGLVGVIAAPVALVMPAVSAPAAAARSTSSQSAMRDGCVEAACKDGAALFKRGAVVVLLAVDTAQEVDVALPCDVEAVPVAAGKAGAVEPERLAADGAGEQLLAGGKSR